MLEQGSPEELAGMVYPFGKGINFSFGMDDVEAVYQRFLDAHYLIMNELEKRSFRVENTEVTGSVRCGPRGLPARLQLPIPSDAKP